MVCEESGQGVDQRSGASRCGVHPGRGGAVRNADWRWCEQSGGFFHRPFRLSYYPTDIMIHKKHIFFVPFLA